MTTWRFHHVLISVLGLSKNVSGFAATCFLPGFSVFPKVYFPLVFLYFCIFTRYSKISIMVFFTHVYWLFSLHTGKAVLNMS